MNVELISTTEDHVTVFTRICIGARKVDALNMILSVNLLSIHFATQCAHKLSNVRPVSHFSNIFQEVA